MKKSINRVSLLLLLLLQVIGSNAQDFNISWALNAQGGLNTDEYPNDICTDSKHSVIVTGQLFDTDNIDFDFVGNDLIVPDGSSDDIFLVKYNNDSTYSWAFSLGSTGDDVAACVTTDSDDNIYICGMFSGTVDFDPSGVTKNLITTNATDLFFASYDENGAYRWAFMVPTGNQNVENLSLVFDGTNLVTGGQVRNTVDFDPSVGVANINLASDWLPYLAKFSTTGALVNAKTYGEDNKVYHKGIEVASSGNIYVTGRFGGALDMDGDGSTDITCVDFGGFGRDIYFAKFNSSLVFQWAKVIAGNPLMVGTVSHASGVDVVIDNSENIYIGGIIDDVVDFDPSAGTNLSTNYSTIAGVEDDEFFLAKYNSSGDHQWGFSVGATFNSGTDENLYKLDINSDNEILVSGSHLGLDNIAIPNHFTNFDPLGGGDFRESISPGSGCGFIATYNSGGILLGMSNSGGGQYKVLNHAIFDDDDNILVTGSFQGVNKLMDGVTHSLSAFGGLNSDIYVVKYGPVPLSLKLANFEANKMLDIVELNWSTYSEVNNDYFTVEKSVDAVNFTPILTRKGAGNSKINLNYKAIDYELKNGVVYYRLKQTDFDGSSSFSKIVTVSNGDDGLKINFYPNPVNDLMILEAEIKENESVIIRVADVTGKTIRIIESKNSITQINVSDLTKGIYYLRIREGAEKFIKL